MTLPVPAPRVRLPSQRGVHPNLSILLAIPQKAADAFGPAVAAEHCAQLSSELRRAARHPSIAGVIIGPLGVDAVELETVADWFCDCAIALARCQQ